MLHNVVQNLTPKVRRDRMGGREYLVVPMVMLTEGVHNGSQGPLFYPAEELAIFPEAWNHKPVVVYHPQGAKSTACDPSVITAQGVGVIMHARTHVRDGLTRLAAEAWLEEERLRAYDSRLLERILKGEVVELSTGLFSENEQKKGEWNGEQYIAVARHYRPDHLAILPDQVGACSVKDGAGLLRNQQTKTEIEMQETKTETTKPAEQKLAEGSQETAQAPAAPSSESAQQTKEEEGQTGTQGQQQPEAKKAEEVKTAAEALVAMRSHAEPTDEQYIANAPREVREMLSHGLRAYDAQRQALVATITSNSKNVLSKAALTALPMDVLEGIARVAADAKTPTRSYAGLADAFMSRSEPTQNVAGDEEPLALPVFNFDKAK